MTLSLPLAAGATAARRRPAVERPRPLLVARPMLAFACTGSACEDTCCAHWHVHFDEKDYLRLTSVPPGPLGDDVRRALVLLETRAGPSDFAAFRMSPGCRCPLLSADRLCRVHGELGEAYLPRVCAVFPRRPVPIGQRTVLLAALGCPEAARGLLAGPEPLDFCELDPTLRDADPSGELTLWRFAVALLQHRGCSLEERLLLLGLFISKLDGWRGADPERLRARMRAQLDAPHDGSLAGMWRSIPLDRSLHLQLLTSLLTLRVEQGLASQRLVDCLNEFNRGLETSADREHPERVLDRYTDAYLRHFEPAGLSSLLERYLVVQATGHRLPMGDQPRAFDSYVQLVVGYASIKLLLVGMARLHGGLSQELVLKLIQSYSKMTDASASYRRAMLAFVRERRLDTMAGMATLLRSAAPC